MTLSPQNGIQFDRPIAIDGLALLRLLPPRFTPLVFFDPQYRSVLDAKRYGNEKSGKGKRRAALPQMEDDLIREFIAEIERVLRPSGYLMLWVDKFILVSREHNLFEGTNLKPVDMITWDKGRIGMGYRTRRRSEHIICLQKNPIRAKGIWNDRAIPDVWLEKSVRSWSWHPHAKPIELQRRLIEATTKPNDVVVDPAAGGYSVLDACRLSNRRFLGCDLIGVPDDATVLDHEVRADKGHI